MSKQTLSRDQLLAHRDEHIQFMKASAASFDAGFIGEAKRMAVSLRVLLHQTPQSHSILGQLGERQRLMLDTAYPYDPNNLLTHHGLVGLQIGRSATFYAPLGDRPTPLAQIKFSDWWEKDIVLKDTGGTMYTRRRLVLFAANKDGGAHVDPVLDTNFENLKSGSGSGWFQMSDQGNIPVKDVIAYSIRQIAYEAIESFKPSPT